jgi:hypothetical protein
MRLPWMRVPSAQKVARRSDLIMSLFLAAKGAAKASYMVIGFAASGGG